MSQLANNALNYFYHGNRYYEAGQLLLAIRSYEKSIELAPNFSKAHQQKRLVLKSIKSRKKSEHRKLTNIKPERTFYTLTFILISFIFFI